MNYPNKTLKLLRLLSGMTLDELSKKTGIQATTLSSYERGEPIKRNLDAYLSGFDLTREEFIDIQARLRTNSFHSIKPKDKLKLLSKPSKKYKYLQWKPKKPRPSIDKFFTNANYFLDWMNSRDVKQSPIHSKLTTSTLAYIVEDNTETMENLIRSGWTLKEALAYLNVSYSDYVKSYFEGEEARWVEKNNYSYPFAVNADRLVWFNGEEYIPVLCVYEHNSRDGYVKITPYSGYPVKVKWEDLRQVITDFELVEE